MKRILTFIILLMPFLGIAQGSTHGFATKEVTRQKIIKNTLTWTFTRTGGKIYYVDKDTDFEIPDATNVVTASRLLTLTAGTGITINGTSSAGQNMSADRTWTIAVSSLGNASIAAGANIDASKLGTGVVSTTVFNYLSNVTSDIQGQFDNLSNTYATILTPTFQQNISIGNNLNTSNYTRLSFSFSNTTASQADLYFDYSYKASFGSIQTKRFLTVKPQISSFSDTLNVAGLLKIPTGAGANKVLTSDANGISSWATISTGLGFTPLNPSNNLSDLGSASTARTNLGLGSLATLSSVNLASNVTGTLLAANGGTGITSLSSGIATFLGTASSANLLAALTTKTGTGTVVFDTSPTITTPLISNVIGGTGTTSTITVQSSNNASATTGSDIIFKNGTTETARILQNGRFGVGTTAPNALFDVSGTGVVSQRISSSNNTSQLEFAGTNGQFINYTGSLYFTNSGTGNLIFNNNGGEAFRINSSKYLGVGTNAPADLFSVGSSSQFQVSSAGVATASQYKISALNTAPASATATGVLGEIRITSTHIYICTATNTWVRAALSTW